jgi:hypothetical protein
MAEFDRARRRFLARILGGTALAGIGLLFGARAARAFTEQKMDPAVHKAWLNACTGATDPYHAQLVAQAEADLKGRMSDAELQQAVAAMRCPICGCALVASAAPTAAAKAG